MKRRNFIYSAIAAGALPMAGYSHLNSDDPSLEKELYEIRTYEVKFRGNKQVLLAYLQDVLAPSLMGVGANHFLFYKELGDSDPTKLWVIISYPNAEAYLKGQQLHKDPAYVTASAEYNGLGPENTLFNRYSSWLLLAFDGMPQLKKPFDGASLFELRTYEGYSEDAVRRKIKMFNKEEIPLFIKTNLHPVFFGEMIAGPYRPCLTYMIHFKDMAEHDASWKEFGSHPEWKVMSSKKEYANSVSNIRKIFLKPL